MRVDLRGRVEMIEYISKIKTNFLIDQPTDLD